MTRNEFIMQIKDEIKGSCALPYSVPDKEISRIIDQAKKWFYRNYGDAVESQYYVIPAQEFRTPAFKATRSVILPDCVVSVYEVKEMSGGHHGRGDFSNQKFMAAELYLSPNESDDLVMRTARASYWDLTKAFFLEHIAYDFNGNTKKLKIKGRDPRKNVFIQSYISIPEEDLFEDWYFIRYCTAMTKMALGRILGFFEYQLPGGISINSGDIASEGKDEVDEIKESISEEQAPDWFMVFH